MMGFVGIDESNFNSVFRRAFVWKPKARFHHETILKNLHPDHELDGHFKADPTLKQFLASAPAAAAGLQFNTLLSASAIKKNVLSSLMITPQAEVITKDKMRASCGLKVRAGPSNSRWWSSGILEVENSQRLRDEEDNRWRNLQKAIIDTLLAGRKLTSVF